jgi:hypothetical protein
MKKFLVGFAAVAVLLVGSFCVANAPSDRALIERVFQVFVEGFSEGDVVKVMSAITDPFVVDGEPLPRSMLAESLEPPDDDSYRSGGFRDLLLTIEGDKAEGSVKRKLWGKGVDRIFKTRYQLPLMVSQLDQEWVRSFSCYGLIKSDRP